MKFVKLYEEWNKERFSSKEEQKAFEVVKTYHGHLGHVGVRKTFKEVYRRYIFPTTVKLYDLVSEVRRRCVTCQVCDPSNWSNDLPMTHNTIPGRVMASVAMDVFYIHLVEWKGLEYDSPFFVWVG
jgi:hypothetical protein